MSSGSSGTELFSSYIGIGARGIEDVDRELESLSRRVDSEVGRERNFNLNFDGGQFRSILTGFKDNLIETADVVGSLEASADNLIDTLANAPGAIGIAGQALKLGISIYEREVDKLNKTLERSIEIEKELQAVRQDRSNERVDEALGAGTVERQRQALELLKLEFESDLRTAETARGRARGRARELETSSPADIPALRRQRALSGESQSSLDLILQEAEIRLQSEQERLRAVNEALSLTSERGAEAVNRVVDQLRIQRLEIEGSRQAYLEALLVLQGISQEEAKRLSLEQLALEVAQEKQRTEEKNAQLQDRANAAFEKQSRQLRLQVDLLKEVEGAQEAIDADRARSSGFSPEQTKEIVRLQAEQRQIRENQKTQDEAETTAKRARNLAERETLKLVELRERETREAQELGKEIDRNARAASSQSSSFGAAAGTLTESISFDRSGLDGITSDLSRQIERVADANRKREQANSDLAEAVKANTQVMGEVASATKENANRIAQNAQALQTIINNGGGIC